MAKPDHDWFLKQWLAATGKKQRDVVADLEWNKAKISLMVSGQQKYTRDEVNELSTYLNIRPFELLMHPDDAFAMRRIHESAAKFVVTEPDHVEPNVQIPAVRVARKGR